MKFNTSAWRADPALRGVGSAARGLWIDMLSLMHEAHPYGELRIAGKTPSTKDLARLLGETETDVKKWLARLEDADVFSRTEEGVIFSRRMKREYERALADKANGSRGGNPKIIRQDNAGVNPPDNPSVKAWDKAKSLELRESDSEAYASDGPPTVSPQRHDLLNANLPPDIRGMVWSEGLERLRRLTGKPADAARSLLGKLLKGANDDCALVLEALRQCPETGDPVAWLTGAAQRRSRGAAHVPGPARNDPPEAWERLATSWEVDDRHPERGRLPVRGGSYLHIVADAVCEAAGLPANWRGDWTPLCEWLDDNIEPQIVPAIRRVARRPRYRPPASLRFFDAAVRERRAA